MKNLFKKVLTSFKKDLPKQGDVDSEWHRGMKGIKNILKYHLKYGEMKPFCLKFIASLDGSQGIPDDANWDTIAPLVQNRIGDFIKYCRENLETWEQK